MGKRWLSGSELEDDRNYYYLGSTTHKQCEHFEKEIQCTGFIHRNTLRQIYCLKCGRSPIVING